MPIPSRPFGSSAKGPVTLYTLESANGVGVDIMNYGATLVSLRTPDGDGNLKDIILGHDRLEDYLSDRNFLGAIVGRYANRIANASFMLDDQKYDLPANDGPNQLHGGAEGFDKALWNPAPYQDAGGCGVRLALNSPHLDQGYPGVLDVEIDYRLTVDGTLSIAMTATTDRPTVVNLASHAYFNLTDEDNIAGHRLKLFASSYTPVDDSLIPTGDLSPVDGTAFDFRTKKAMTRDYDHNFVVDGTPGTLRPVAYVCDPVSGRRLRVSSTQPGVQFYTGNNLTGAFQPRAGFCLETQHFPDSPNRPDFPSVRVDPDHPYKETIEYRFGDQAAT